MIGAAGIAGSDPTKIGQRDTQQQELSDRMTADFEKSRDDKAGDPVSIPSGLRTEQTNALTGALNGTDPGDGFARTPGVEGANVVLAQWQGGNEVTPRGPDQPFDRELVRMHPSFEAARNQAITEAGPLGPNARPVYGRLGDSAGAFVGMQSADGLRGFRLDYAAPDPNNPNRPSGPHWNWWDRSEGTKRGAGERTGAEYFPGGREAYETQLRGYQRFDPAVRQQNEQQQQQQQVQQQQAQEGMSLRDRIGLITGLSGAALTAYLIVSEGSRLFPPRNLIPIP